jgi:thiol-disulfide isomerase/thioredoxin
VSLLHDGAASFEQRHDALSVPDHVLELDVGGGGELLGLLRGLSLSDAEGRPFDLGQTANRTLVLNFWATWCPPCVKELPELDRFHREWSARGWQVVGLAVDGLKPVQEFLRKQPLSFRVGMAGLEGTALSRQLGNAQGALPFTAVFDSQGRLAHRKLGQTDFEELSAWARGL